MSQLTSRLFSMRMSMTIFSAHLLPQHRTRCTHTHTHFTPHTHTRYTQNVLSAKIACSTYISTRLPHVPDWESTTFCTNAIATPSYPTGMQNGGTSKQSRKVAPSYPLWRRPCMYCHKCICAFRFWTRSSRSMCCIAARGQQVLKRFAIQHKFKKIRDREAPPSSWTHRIHIDALETQEILKVSCWCNKEIERKRNRERERPTNAASPP